MQSVCPIRQSRREPKTPGNPCKLLKTNRTGTEQKKQHAFLPNEANSLIVENLNDLLSNDSTVPPLPHRPHRRPLIHPVREYLHVDVGGLIPAVAFRMQLTGAAAHGIELKNHAIGAVLRRPA